MNALGTGAAVTYGDRAPAPTRTSARTRDERVVAMLAAWRAEIEAEPIPELIDLDTAVAAVVAGVKADAAGTRRKRADRLRHLAPLAAAAAIIVAAVSGVGLGSQNAMPGDALWPVQKVVNPERAESVETKLVVESRFEEVRTALETGDTEAAASLLQAISAEIPAGPRRGGAAAARPGAGVPGREAGRHAAGQVRGPVHAADEQAERPLDHVGHRAAAVGRPRPARRRSRRLRTTRRSRSRSARTSGVSGRRARRSFRHPLGVGFGQAVDAGLRFVHPGRDEATRRAEAGPGQHRGLDGSDHQARAVVRRPAGVRGRHEPARVGRCGRRDDHLGHHGVRNDGVGVGGDEGRRDRDDHHELTAHDDGPLPSGRGPLPLPESGLSRRTAPRPRNRGSTPS